MIEGDSKKIMEEQKQRDPRGSALIPFIIFVGVYLITGIVLDIQGVDSAFYQLPTPIAAFVGIIAAFVMFRGSLDEKLRVFMKGCGDENIMTMCMIYLFAGAFTAVSKEMGGIDAAVNIGMSVIPPQFLAAGAFVISAFIAISTGTSVGTIVAVTPITIGLAQAGHLNVYLVVGATIGGAMFGDNLSMISDTTIAATRTQGCEMKDKFYANFRIALPPAIVTTTLLLIFGRPDTVPPVQEYPVNFVKVLPYLFVLIAALAGVNVFAVLIGGILFSGVIGLACGSFGMLGFAQNIYSGFTGMFEIFLLSMVTGGLGAMVTEAGGLDWILMKVSRVIRGRRSAEAGISVMVALTDFATANNTVAIIISSPVARDLSRKYGVDPKRSASLLDIFSCVVQGIIPYGAQVLYACALLENLRSPFQVVGCCWYSYLLMISAIVSIFFSRAPKKDLTIEERAEEEFAKDENSDQ
jgi:Na+/H+ antiporter NhaC